MYPGKQREQEMKWRNAEKGGGGEWRGGAPVEKHRGGGRSIRSNENPHKSAVGEVGGNSKHDEDGCKGPRRIDVH